MIWKPLDTTWGGVLLVTLESEFVARLPKGKGETWNF
jgi:hypothetical protein